MKKKTFTQGLVLTLLAVMAILPITTGGTSLAAEPIERPPSPGPGYEWIDSGQQLYLLTLNDVEYEPKIVVGAYIPERFEIGETRPVLIYVTRLSEDVSALDAHILSLDSTGNAYGVNICAGIGVEVGVPMGLSWYVHLGIGITVWGKTFWDSLWLKHIPIGGSPLAQSTEDFKEGSLKILPERVSYERISDIPYGKWDGPFTTDVTPELEPTFIVTGLVESETPFIEVQPGLPTTIQFQNIDVKELTINPLVMGEGITYAAIKIQQLTDKPPSIVAALPNSVYHYFVINTNVEDGNVSSVDIQFEVERAWIAENGIDEQTIRLNWYNPRDEIWESLPTEKIGKDDLYVHYSATSPGLSLFAVTGELEKATPITLWLAVGVGIGMVVLMGVLIYFMTVGKRAKGESDKGE
jgi:PGF-pre-PGF domain-containing protein